MSAEFKSFRDILREAREAQMLPAPAMSPLIAEAPPTPQPDRDRLAHARLEERLEHALGRLLEEIAIEVLGRELLLAPVEIGAIVERLLQRYALSREAPVYSADGDVIIGELDASLGRRLRAAIDRALR